MYRCTSDRTHATIGAENCVRKGAPEVLLSADLVILAHGQGRKKRYEMVELSDAIEQDRYKRSCLKSLRVRPNV